MPVVEYHRKRGTVEEVDAMKDIDTVYQQVRAAVDARMGKDRQ